MATSPCLSQAWQQLFGGWLHDPAGCDGEIDISRPDTVLPGCVFSAFPSPSMPTNSMACWPAAWASIRQKLRSSSTGQKRQLVRQCSMVGYRGVPSLFTGPQSGTPRCDQQTHWSDCSSDRRQCSSFGPNRVPSAIAGYYRMARNYVLLWATIAALLAQEACAYCSILMMEATAR